MTIDSHKTISRSASSFFFGTLISRFTGMARDMALAYFFGSSAFIAAFMVAYRFANLFRRLFGETALGSGFVPHFEQLKSVHPTKAVLFYRDLFFAMTTLLSFVVLASEGVLFSINKIQTSSNFQEIIYLTMLMFPGLIFICLYSLNSSFMQCEKKYFLSSLAPSLFNITWIVAAFLFRHVSPSKAVFYLSIATVFAFFIQWAVTFSSTYNFFSTNLGVKHFFKPNIFSGDLKALIRPMSLGVIGVGAVQINTALDALFARVADLSGPAYLWYAMRIHQLPLALFGIAISGAVFPPLARAVQKGDLTAYQGFILHSFNKTIAFMISATFGLIALGGSAINLIFARGEFGANSVYNTQLCLISYSLGLVFSTFVLILSSAFYAKKNYSIPTRGALYSVGINVLLNGVFVYLFHFKSVSIAIATSISSLFNYIFLIRNMDFKIFDKKLIFGFLKVAFSNLGALILTLFVGCFVIHDSTVLFLLKKEISNTFPDRFVIQISHFTILSLTYLGSLISFAYLLKSDEILFICRVKKRRFQE